MISLVDELEACEGWNDALADQRDLLKRLDAWLVAEEKEAHILPDRGLRLRALNQTPLEAVKVVITGQDPYPGVEGSVPHAMGLSFSVPRGIKPPRSLVNIYKELAADCGLVPPMHGDLSGWASQGVLMLNSTLTLRQGEAASHARKGWEAFTHTVLTRVNHQRQPVVFLAWGRHSHKLLEDVDEQRHCVIRTSHPSPLGATKAGNGFDAFLGSRCFSRANDFLASKRGVCVDWCRL